jgi:hypothetical protein
MVEMYEQNINGYYQFDICERTSSFSKKIAPAPPYRNERHNNYPSNFEIKRVSQLAGVFALK